MSVTGRVLRFDDDAPEVFLRCGACRGTARLPAGGPGSCAVCATTGMLPWDSLSPAGRRQLVDGGARPFRFQRVYLVLEGDDAAG